MIKMKNQINKLKRLTFVRFSSEVIKEIVFHYKERSLQKKPRGVFLWQI